MRIGLVVENLERLVLLKGLRKPVHLDRFGSEEKQQFKQSFFKVMVISINNVMLFCVTKPKLKFLFNLFQGFLFCLSYVLKLSKFYFCISIKKKKKDNVYVVSLHRTLKKTNYAQIYSY